MRKALLIIAILLLAGCAPGAATRGWEWVNPRPTGEDLQAVAFGDGRYVAVGRYGTIITSGDGEHWEAAPVAPDAMLTDVAFGHGRFVAVGMSYPDPVLTGPDAAPAPPIHLVYTSRAGKQWQRRETGETGRFSNVAFGNGRFVAVGTKGISVSTDGDTWEEAARPRLQIESLIYGGGRFVAAGRGGTVTSEDGVTWVSDTNQPDFNWLELMSVTYGDGQFVAVSNSGQIWSSDDAVTWTKRKTVPFMLDAVTYGQGRFVAAGGRKYATSADGVTWEISDTYLPRPISSLVQGQEMLVAVGERGAVLSSRDGLSWTEHYPVLQSDFHSVAYDGERYVAVGKGKFLPIGEIDDPTRPSVVLSRDGTTWVSAAAPVAGDLNQVVYGNGAFVAIGRSVYTSDDGDRWEQTLDDDLAQWPSALAFGGGRFVVVTASPERVYTSTEGRSWEPVDLGEGAVIRSITWGNGRFVGVGNEHAAVVSADGRTWTKVQLPVADAKFVTFGQDKFVALGELGEVLTSADGSAWTVHPDQVDLVSLVYGEGMFVGTDGARVYGSDDGVGWTGLPQMTSRGLSAVGFAGGRLWLLGDGGIVTRRVWE